MSCNNMKIFLKFLLIFHLLSSTIAKNTSPSSSSPPGVLYEVLPFVRVYTNGRTVRMSGTMTVPSGIDPKTKVLSKDINIDPNKNISARLFLPENPAPNQKYPLLVYFHGGGFMTGSPFNPSYHNHLNSLAGEGKVVAVSVNYRLAPENLLPIGYEDCWLALRWVFSHNKTSSSSSNRNNAGEPWLKNFVDFGHVYLGGDSAGGNIAHNMAMRAGLRDKKYHGVEIYGIFLNCPHFWGSKLIGNEPNNPRRAAWVESIWIHAYPNSTGFDDPLSNPAMDPNLSKLGAKRVLVIAAEKDILRDRALNYVKTLRESKWSGTVKALDVKRKDHVFNIVMPNTPKANDVLSELASFLNDGNDGKV